MYYIWVIITEKNKIKSIESLSKLLAPIVKTIRLENHTD